MGGFDDAEVPGAGFVLRGLVADDVGDLVQTCNDPDVRRWLPLPSPYLDAHARWFVEEWAPAQQESGAGLVRAITVRGRFHGTIDLRKADWRVPSVEISYMVAPWGRGQGLAARGAQLLSTWAPAQGMKRIELRAAVGNDASLRTARAAGFTEEGVLRQAGVTHAGPVDLVVFSRLASDDPST